MNKIYVVVIEGNYFYEEDRKICYGDVERIWIDSYWTNEIDAIKEGDRLWNENKEGRYESISVIEKTLNIRGQGANLWDSNSSRFVKSWY